MRWNLHQKRSLRTVSHPLPCDDRGLPFVVVLVAERLVPAIGSEVTRLSAQFAEATTAPHGDIDDVVND
jgi:hypothetical protein